MGRLRGAFRARPGWLEREMLATGGQAHHLGQDLAAGGTHVDTVRVLGENGRQEEPELPVIAQVSPPFPGSGCPRPSGLILETHCPQRGLRRWLQPFAHRPKLRA